MYKIFKISCTFSCLLLLAACSSNKESEEQLTDQNVIYNEALSNLLNDDYEKASEKFELLEREHPTSDLAPKSQIRRAYSLYLNGKFIEAIVVIDNFIKQYPLDRDTDYMYYLRGLCYYDQILDVGRDQDLTIKSIDAFKVLIARYPNSMYSRDAKLKIEYATNLLAGKEMEIGRFYLNQNQYIAAINRFKIVVDKYQQSIFIPEALFRLVELYYALGDINQANNYASVLDYNFPETHWSNQAKQILAGQGSDIEIPWYQKITKQLW